MRELERVVVIQTTCLPFNPVKTAEINLFSKSTLQLFTFYYQGTNTIKLSEFFLLYQKKYWVNLPKSGVASPCDTKLNSASTGLKNDHKTNAIQVETNKTRLIRPFKVKKESWILERSFGVTTIC